MYIVVSIQILHLNLLRSKLKIFPIGGPKMDEKKNTQTSSTKTPVSINAMSKMMAMQASLPELIYNLKLMGVNVGGSIINPFVAMTFVQAIETAVQNTDI